MLLGARLAISTQARATCSPPSIGRRKVVARPPPSAIAVASGSSRPIRASMSLASHAALNALTMAACWAVGLAGACDPRMRRRAEEASWRHAAGARVFTGASETLRLSGIDADINTSGRYQAVKPRGLAMDRDTQMDEIRRLLASPDVAAGSVAAVTETGSLVVASATGSQLPGYAAGSARVIWVVGAQKVALDLSTALRRVEDHCLPLESARAQAAYGQPSAINRLLILNAEPHPGRGTVLLLREVIGF